METMYWTYVNRGPSVRSSAATHRETIMAQARRPASSETGDPLLLTPGPLTTSKAIKEAIENGTITRSCTTETAN